MKKLIQGFLYFGISLFLLTSCSNDDDNSDSTLSTATFKVNNEVFNLIPGNAMTGIRMADTPIKGQNRLSLSISGIQGSAKVSTVSFDLFYVSSQGVSGTYTMYDENSTDDLEVVVTKKGRVCSAWTSLANVTGTSGSLFVNSNDPTGTVTVKDNGNGTYTVVYSGNYREYNDDDEVSRTIPVEVNVTSTVTFN